ncbi:hypothetical protein ACF07V_17640 [Streptomyces sp. NPDC015661]|uniref:hypothetical protein n=1 Tax=Streptomyces sp. NPDC015661 TaxID=3364961 RepID=UPI0036FF0591
MRATRALLVGASVLALGMGTPTVSQALGWEHPWTAHNQSSTLSPAHSDGDKDKEHHKGKGGTYDLDHSCKGGTFGYCTQNAVFAPTIIGDLGLTTGLIGLTGTTGQNGQTATTTSTTSTTSTTQTTSTTATTATTSTTATTATTTPPPPNQWCSPGYWFNRGLDNWPAPYDPATSTWSDLPTPPYTDTLARTNAGVAANAPANPLLTYIWNPQNANNFAAWYVRPRGEVLNDIADVLSSAAGLTWTDKNTATCPLN